MLLLTISVRVHRQEERLQEKRKVAYMKDIVSPDCTSFSKVHVELYNSQQHVGSCFDKCIYAQVLSEFRRSAGRHVNIPTKLPDLRIYAIW